MTSIRFFIAGIIQGSWRDTTIHAQDYRQQLTQIIEQHFEGASVYDPFAGHPSSINYDEMTGRRVFYTHNLMCREKVDVLIAFVPEASMGTAVEMWEAYQSGAAVFAISPLKTNWAVKYLSHDIYDDLAQFEADLISGVIARRIDTILADRTNPTLDVLQ